MVNQVLQLFLKKKFIYIIILSFLIGLPSQVFCQKKSSKNLVSFNFKKDIDIRSLVDIVSKVTSKTIVFNEKIMRGKKITIRSSKSYPPDEAFDVFAAILYVNGLTFIEDEKIIRIVERKAVRNELTPIYKKFYRVTESSLQELTEEGIPDYILQNLKSLKSKRYIARQDFLEFLEKNLSTDDYGDYSRVIYEKTYQEAYSRRKNEPENTVTQIIEIKYVPVNTIRSLLQNVDRENNSIVPYTENNLLIVKDTREGLDQILQIIKELDVPDPNRQIDYIELKYSNAQTLVNILNRIFGYTNRRKIPHEEKPFLTQDDRTNRIIAVASYQIIRKVKQIVAELDQPFADEEGSISIVRLKFADANDISRILKQIFISAAKKKKISAAAIQAEIIPINSTNQLILIGGEKFIEKVTLMIERLDQVSDSFSLELIPLKNAYSNDIANLLNKIFKRAGNKNAASSLLILADERTNSLIVQASPNLLDVIKQVVGDLDGEVDQRSGNIHVRTLNNAKAEDIAKVLQQVTQTFQSAKKKGAQGNQKVSIIPDSTTNSLVIFANKTEFPILENVIKKLDVIRPQVYVEALIMEVTLGKSLNLGIQWQSSQVQQVGNNKTTATIGSPGGTGQPQSAESVATQSGAIGFLPDADQLGTFNGTTYLPFSAFIQAAQTDSEIDILANPQVLTLNKQEAEIKVGETRAFQKDTVVTVSGATTSFEYKELGIAMKILPQINADNTIQLKVETTSTSVLSEQVGTTNTPTTLNRSIKTEILVDSGQTIVLGGLINDQIDNLNSKTPCLGDIPILGWLFKSNTYNRDKTNLLVFINPRIVKTKEELQAISDRGKDKLKAAKEGKFRESIGRRYDIPDVVKDPVVRERLERQEWKIRDLKKKDANKPESKQPQSTTR